MDLFLLSHIKCFVLRLVCLYFQIDNGRLDNRRCHNHSVVSFTHEIFKNVILIVVAVSILLFKKHMNCIESCITSKFADFSQTSKRLGELWATVPFNEKYVSINS